MPTDAWRRSAGFMPLAALPTLGSDYPRPNEHIISSLSSACLGAAATSSWASVAYSAANRALAMPFEIAHPFLVRKVFWFNGTTASTDSADVGVYDEALVRLVSGGGTAISGASSVQEADVTDTLLQPGRYYLAYAQNGTTATPIMNASGVSVWRVAGCFQMSSAYVLPSSLTPEVPVNTTMPLCGIASRTLVA